MSYPSTVDYKYERADKCRYCGSSNMQYPIKFYEMCNNCGKHTLLGVRFPFLEIDRNSIYKYDEEWETFYLNTPEITIKKIKDLFIDKEVLLDSVEKREDGFYTTYRDEMLKEDVDVKLSDKRLKEADGKVYLIENEVKYKYDEKNRLEGSYYYYVKKIVEGLKE